MKKILIATTNISKYKEIKKCLSHLSLHFMSLFDLNIKSSPEEKYNTFKQNAIHKAKYYCQLSSLPTVADDGGIEIDYLNKAPGVVSRRWVNGSDDITDGEIIDHTLLKLKGVPVPRRSAVITTTIALFLPSGKYFTASGYVKGIIAAKPHPRIIEGFPYRSLLYLPDINKYYHDDDLTPMEKDKFNHRKKVLGKLEKYIVKYVV